MNAHLLENEDGPKGREGGTQKAQGTRAAKPHEELVRSLGPHRKLNDFCCGDGTFVLKCRSAPEDK